MKLTEKEFRLFDREEFAFKKIKEHYSEEEVEDIKAAFKAVWEKWKTLQLDVYRRLPETLQLARPKIESWTNGWNLRNHFWSAYRGSERQQENACLGVLLNKKQLQIYLMFQHYKSDQRQGSPEDYNQLLQVLAEWSETVDISHYFIWRQQESELTDHLPLADYLANKAGQSAFFESLEDRTFQLGKLYFRGEEIPEAETCVLEGLLELYPLYERLGLK